MLGKINMKIWQGQRFAGLGEVEEMLVCDILEKRLKSDLRSLQLCFLRWCSYWGERAQGKTNESGYLKTGEGNTSLVGEK